MADAGGDDDRGSPRIEIDVVGRRRKPRHDGLTPARCTLFLDTLAETCCVQSAAAASGIAVTNLYRRRRNDADFAAQWLEALTIGYETVEARLLRYALTDDPVAEAARQSAEGDSADPVFRPGSGLPPGQAPAWVPVAMHLLNRHRATVEGRRIGMKLGHPATPEETDATLTRRLDQLARARQGRA